MKMFLKKKMFVYFTSVKIIYYHWLLGKILGGGGKSIRKIKIKLKM